MLIRRPATVHRHRYWVLAPGVAGLQACHPPAASARVKVSDWRAAAQWKPGWNPSASRSIAAPNARLPGGERWLVPREAGGLLLEAQASS